MGMHFKQVADFLGISHEHLQSAAQRCGVCGERLASGRLERSDLAALLAWAEAPGNAEQFVDSTGPKQEEVLKRLSYLASADSRFRLMNDPESGAAPARTATPKAVFSLFLAPGAAKASEAARLLAEISKLQRMLGGNGVEYRLAGVRSAPAGAEATPHSIVRWEALPRPRADGRLSRRDLYAMEILGRFLGAKTIQVDALGEEFVRGAEAARNDAAHTLAREAGDAAAALIGGEGRSDDALAAPSSAAWTAQMAEVDQIDSRPLKFLTLAKFFDENATLTSQLAQIMDVISTLRAMRGAQAEVETIERRDPILESSRPYFTPLEIDLG